jgi:hypothetical protein
MVPSVGRGGDWRGAFKYGTRRAAGGYPRGYEGKECQQGRERADGGHHKDSPLPPKDSAQDYPKLGRS